MQTMLPVRVTDQKEKNLKCQEVKEEVECVHYTKIHIQSEYRIAFDNTEGNGEITVIEYVDVLPRQERILVGEGGDEGVDR